MIFLLACIQYIMLSDYLVVMPMGPTLMSTFELDTSQFAALVSVYSVGAIVVSVLTAGILDKFNRVRELQLSFLLFVIVSILHVFVPNYTMLLWLRFLSGGLAGLCGSLILAVISQNYPKNRCGRIIGTVLSATSVAQIIAIPLGLFLMVKFGWKSPFVINAILGLSVLMGLLTFKVDATQSPQKKGKKSPVFQQLSRIFGEKFHFKAMLCTFLSMFAGTLIIPFLPLKLVYQFGVPEHHLGGVYLIGGILAFISSFLAGRLSEWGVGKFAVYFIFSIGTVPLVLFTVLKSMHPWLAIVLFTLCSALLVVRMIPINRLVMEFIHPEFMGGFQSINTALLHLGASLAAWTGGQLIHTTDNGISGFAAVAMVSITVLFVLFPLVTFGFRREPK